MSRPIICDFCGRRHYGNSFTSDGSGHWRHHYQTGRDECPVCIKKRMKAESDAMWARIRADIRLTLTPPSPAHNDHNPNAAQPQE